MNAEKTQQIQAYARGITTLLYDKTIPEQITTSKGIEVEFWSISAQKWSFSSQLQATPVLGEKDNSEGSN